VRAEPPAVPTGFWPSVGPNNNVFATERFIESFMDELARKAGLLYSSSRKAGIDGAAPVTAVLHGALPSRNRAAALL